MIEYLSVQRIEISESTSASYIARSARLLALYRQPKIPIPNISAIYLDFFRNFFKSNFIFDQEDNLGAKILDYLEQDLELAEIDFVDRSFDKVQ